MNEKGSIMK